MQDKHNKQIASQSVGQPTPIFVRDLSGSVHMVAVQKTPRTGHDRMTEWS
jgi:hypothetical protein